MTAPNWNTLYADRTRLADSEAIKEVLRLIRQPGIISFAGGVPAPEMFPYDRVREATARVMADATFTQALQYGLTEGYPPLRQLLADEMTAQGVPCTVDNVLITTGSQQGLNLIAAALINPGDRVIVEEPTYFGMLQVWNSYAPDYVQVATDDDGILPAALEEALKAGPTKLIYLIPNFQNPMGVTIHADRRAEIVRLAAQYGVPIIEDDPYGKLRFEGEAAPSLIAHDARRHGGPSVDAGNVLNLGTFSKMLAPGFRVAWVIGPAEVIRELATAKQGNDLHTSTFSQIVAYETAKDGFVDRHVVGLREVYRARRDAMLEALEETFPPGVTWTHPEGGLFLWVRLPDGLDANDVLARAVEAGVAYVPGPVFFPNGGGQNTFRMSFATAEPDVIGQGVTILAGVIREALAETTA